MPFSVLLLDTEPRTQNHYLVIAIADALRRHPAVSDVVLAGHADAIRTLRDRSVDVFIAFGGARVHAPLLSRLASLARYSVLWSTEDPYELDANLRFSTSFDIVFSNDGASVAAYNGRARHLPLAASPLFQDFPVWENEQDYLYDLLFIGTAWPNRVASLNAIAVALPNTAKLKLALPWNEYIGPPALWDPSQITDWRCGNRDFARLANRSRIVLTLPRAFSASNVDTASGSTPPPRLFEAALAGGFQVVVAPDPEVHAYYDATSEICVCPDDATAVAAIVEHLRSPEIRIEKAKAARARTVRDHLYDQRVDRIIEAVETVVRPAVPSQAPHHKTVLVVTHNRRGYRSGGGIEVYQEQATLIGGTYRFLFLFPVLRNDGWDIRLQGEGLDRIFSCGPLPLPQATNPAVEKIFEEILYKYDVDLVHFHHLLHLPLSLPILAKACGVPVVYHLHDHYLICERWLLLDQAGRFCDVVHRGSDQCDACLVDTENYPVGAKARRDGMMARVVAAIDAFVTSTSGTGAYLRLFYPEIDPSRIVEIEMLSPTSPAPQAAIDRAMSPARRKLVVAIVGSFSAHKGGDAIIDVIRLCEGYDIGFEIFGHLSDHHRGRLAGFKAGIVTLHGAYDQHTIVSMLGGCDVSLHLSIWPETYVLALTEAWLAGLVPIVSDLGALGERVTDGVDGFVVRPHHPGGVMARLLELYFDPDRLTEMRSTIGLKIFASADDHLRQMRDLYRDLIAAAPCPHDRVPDRAQGPFELTLATVGIRLNADSWVSPAIAWDSGPAAQAATVISAHADVMLTAEMDQDHQDYQEVLAPLTDRETSWSLDEFRVDDTVIGFRTGCEVAIHHVSVRGWFCHAVWRRPTQTYLRLVGPEGIRYAKLHVHERPDLVSDLGDQAAARAGFIGRFQVHDLTPGVQRIDIVQVASGRLLIAQGCLQFFAAPTRGDGTKAIWSRIDVPDLEHEREHPIGPLRHNLPVVDGYVMARSMDDWAVAATVGNMTTSSTLQAVLVSNDDAASFAVPMHVVDPSAETGLTAPARAAFVASFADLPAGRYTLVIRAADAGWVTPEIARIALVSGEKTYRLTNTQPRGIRSWNRRRLRRCPIIEEVALSQEAGWDGLRVTCRGWAFVRELGEPVCTLTQWQSDSGVRHCIGTPLARPDIAARLDRTDADACGFSIAFPTDALTKGRIRFFQCYAHRTVEFLSFDREIRQILDRQGAGAGTMTAE